MIVALAVSALLSASAATVADDPDGLVATAPRGGSGAPPVAAAPVLADSPATARLQDIAPHGMSTDEQIAAWIAARDPEAPVYREEASRDDRKTHGEFDVAVGTGGYRRYGAAVSLPVGTNGRLDLSYSQTENGYPGYDYDPHYFGGGAVFDSGYIYPGRGPETLGPSDPLRVRRPPPPGRPFPALSPPRADEP